MPETTLILTFIEKPGPSPSSNLLFITISKDRLHSDLTDHGNRIIENRLKLT